VAFDKLYFIGGANSLRGWRPRTIGPGIYAPSTNNFRIDRAGDLVIQGSVEYRFDLIKNKLEGAFFTDAGNIWILRNENNVNPDKLFKINQSYKDIAANAGIGARIDFQFFLFRLDYGFQIHNPELVGTERWVIKDFARNQYFSKYGLLNFGIGYPF
jgi:outer membrane protein assembly factor BamA